MHWTLLLCLLSVSIWRTHAQVRSDSILDARILEGIDLTLKQEYDQADSLFETITREFPERPEGYLYQAAVIQSRVMDYKLDMKSPVLDSLLIAGIEKAEQMIRKEPNSPWGYFFLGTALGYESYARVYREEWFGGIAKAMSSVGEFKKAIERDSTLYDAYVGIGTYYYWKSRKTEFLHWLPFISDDRSEGITFIERTARNGLYNRYTALSVLASIQLDAGNFKEAERCAEIGLKKYPRNRIFLWEYSAALERQGKYREAADVYLQLLDVIQTNGQHHGYNEMVCRLNLANCFAALGNSGEALAQLQSIQKLRDEKFPPHLQTRAQERLAEASVLERRLVESKASSK